MARVFITGSSDGLGRLAARLLVEQGHGVVLHARNAARGREAMAAVPGAEGVLCADLESLGAVKALAAEANATGRFDAVIHNAAVGYKEKKRRQTADGFAHVLAVNTLAPFVLTALMERPGRLVYVGSELHRRGDASLRDLNWDAREWRGNQAYSDTKLHDTLLCFAVARRWRAVRSNATEPGWVPTKMSPRATGDLAAAFPTQAWLAVGEGVGTGGYFFHMRPRVPSGAAADPAVQDRLVAACESLTGVRLPG